MFILLTSDMNFFFGLLWESGVISRSDLSFIEIVKRIYVPIIPGSQRVLITVIINN